jgi:hypothetical protein
MGRLGIQARPSVGPPAGDACDTAAGLFLAFPTPLG